MLRNGLSNVMFQLTELQRVTKYMDRVRKFFEIKSEIEPNHGMGLCPGSKPMEIELCDVRFSYAQPEDDDKKFVIDGLSMRIEPGKKLPLWAKTAREKPRL